jgi:hypothetical protein
MLTRRGLNLMIRGGNNMSKFLGKVHFWLYDKIRYSEQIEESIINWGKEEGKLSIEQWRTEINDKFGAPLGDVPLEEIIDQGNIHGWLQDKISRAELRQAAFITNILNISEGYRSELIKLFKANGFMRGTAASENYSVESPEEIYKVINEYILEGMPCDPIDRKIESNGDVYKWLTSYCIHEQYWNEIGGDTKNFYEMRQVWLESFVNALNNKYVYEVENIEGKRLNIIRKVV